MHGSPCARMAQFAIQISLYIYACTPVGACCGYKGGTPYVHCSTLSHEKQTSRFPNAPVSNAQLWCFSSLPITHPRVGNSLKAKEIWYTHVSACSGSPASQEYKLSMKAQYTGHYKACPADMEDLMCKDRSCIARVTCQVFNAHPASDAWLYMLTASRCAKVQGITASSLT